MIKTKVKCSKAVAFDKNLRPISKVYLAIPSDTGQGYDLISCLRCGTIYCIDQISETYNQGIVKRSECIKCKSKLSETSHPYPAKFITEDNIIHDFHNPYLANLPPEEDQFFEEFYDLHLGESNKNKDMN